MKMTLHVHLRLEPSFRMTLIPNIMWEKFEDEVLKSFRFVKIPGYTYAKNDKYLIFKEQTCS